MRNSIISCVFAVVVLAGGSAFAQGEVEREGPTGVGVGAEATITGLNGITVIYDASDFRIDGLLGFDNDDNRYNNGDDTLVFGGRFLWVLHRATAADFSIGAGLTFEHIDYDERGRDSDLDTHLELLGQLRAFLVPNVALSASFGAGVVFRDGNERILLDGQVVGAIGIAYFFY